MINQAGFLAFPIFALILGVLPSPASDADQVGFEIPQPEWLLAEATKQKRS